MLETQIPSEYELTGNFEVNRQTVDTRGLKGIRLMVSHVLNCQKKENVMMASIIGPVDNQVILAQLSDELTQLYDQLMEDEEIRVLVLTSDGEKSFSMDTDSFGPLLGDVDELGMKPWSLAELIAKFDQPVIAAIHGDAIGQGLELALACDMRIAVETSHFGLPHIKTGLIPWDGGTQRLSRLVGRGKTLEMILTGEIIDAKEAYRIGLINKIVPSGELVTVVMGIAKEMASKGPIALRYAKETIYKGMDMTLEQGLHLETDLYLLLHTTQDRTEGIKAFLGKRIPRFEGK